MILYVTFFTMGIALVATEDPCECPRDAYRPVCGTDNIVYYNYCHYRCSKTIHKHLQVKHASKCRRISCDCKDDYDPICATNGVSYRNKCLFFCEKLLRPGITINHRGYCKPYSCNCPVDSDPICGTNDVSYNNMCTLRCASITDEIIRVKHTGLCTTLLSDIVKDDDYKNGLKSSLYKAKTRKIIDDTEAKPKGPNTCTCTREYDPICASDGNTYSNQCLMRCKGLEMVKHGSC